QSILNQVKDGSKVNPKNFAILEQEYKKIPDLLVEFFVSQNLLNQGKDEREELPKPGLGFEEDVPEPGLGRGVSPSTTLRANLSVRQEKILEFLKSKEKAQVWELQKMLPEPVTKRTLRRDMDDLMQKGRVERQGEWNGVFYKLNQAKEEEVAN
ncbi:MAG: DeoR family transcriptional regulator, partial [bacterium]|nr:DeoR family transcriptional regulator [bacterium]